MKGVRIVVFLAVVSLALGMSAAAEERLRLASGTTPADTGLLHVLLPPFEKKYNCRVDVIAVGTGKALNMGEAGIVDVVLVHARKLEDQFVAEGYGVNRRDVMYDDFVLIGPTHDPAGVKRAKTAAEAMKRIAARRSLFVSRSDESGTYQREKYLWEAAGIKPVGRWYIEAGLGMGETIIMASERRAYALSDRGTYNKYHKNNKTDLKILFQGEKTLLNPYGVIAVNPKKYDDVNYDLAMKFIDYITGNEGQGIIAGFKVEGVPIFFPFAKQAE